MTSIDLDLTTLAEEGEEEETQEVVDAAKGLATAIVTVGKNDQVSNEDKVALFKELTEIARTGRRQLHARQPLALGGSSGTPVGNTSSDIPSDQLEELQAIATSFGWDLPRLLKIMIELFKPLTSVTPAQASGRAIAMQAVATGNEPVRDDGTLQVTEEKSKLDTELATAKNRLNVFNSIVGKYERLASQADRDAFSKAMDNLASGVTPYDSNGVILISHQHPWTLAIEDVKANSGREPFEVRKNILGGFKKEEHLVVDDGNLADDTLALFGWKK